MSAVTRVDRVVIGGGLVGLASARALLEEGRSLAVLEAESSFGAHQSGHNSGVIHSGLYYVPGSHKARTCVEGRRLLLEFCRAHDVAHEVCGKLVVATHASELPALARLEERAAANGLEGVRRLEGVEALREHEPEVTGVAGLWVPQTGIVDFPGVVRALVAELRSAGAECRSGARLRAVQREGDDLILETTAGTVRTAQLVNCAGLQCDRVARMCGAKPDVRIIPFRGEYYRLRDERRDLVRGLIYPVPDPRFPFLGVHLTRRIDGVREAGPNAVLALRREGYRTGDVSLRDLRDLITWPGTWRMAAKHAATGLAEEWRSKVPRAFAQALRKLVPALAREDLVSHGAGVRAQAVDRAGGLIDDFHFAESPGCVHVLNAPSPAATACLAIGQEVARRVRASSPAG